MGLTAFGSTDKGRTREMNEDSICVDEPLGLYAVADGMGGHAAGDVASNLAIDTIKGHLKDKPNPMATDLLEAVSRANTKVYGVSQKEHSREGMGTTVVAALIKKKWLNIAHVGDSRAYLIRDGQLRQLTDDHSLVAEQLRDGLISEQEAKTSRFKHIITRALGIGAEVQVDHYGLKLRGGDKVLICSDGLYNMVPADDLLAGVMAAKAPESACKSLIELANKNGGRDNISIVLLSYQAGGLGFLFDKLSSLKTRRAHGKNNA